MKNASKLIIGVFSLTIFITGCSEEDNYVNSDKLEETDDLQTLIETNEYLIKQLEKEQEEVDELKETIDQLKNENMDLKDNILTYKQQIYELEDQMIEERELRNELDEMAKTIFDAMNQKNHNLLETLIANNIQVSADKEILDIVDDNGKYSFQYLSLSNVYYVRQSDYKYDHEEGSFITKYTLYAASVKGDLQEEEVYLTFKKDGDWKLARISYHP